MIKTKRVVFSIIFLVGTFYFTACEEYSTSSIEESLELVPKVTAIEGAQNTNLRVNEGLDKSYFTIDFSNIKSNNYITNGIHEGWCIAYDKPINSDGQIQKNLKLSLAEDNRWQPIRRLLGIKDQLLANNPDITYREVQVAIWVLRDFPKFDLNNISADDIPSRMVTNGEFNFSKEKVRDIVAEVKTAENVSQKSKTNGLLNQSYHKLEKEICVVETDSETQTVIVPCDETFWAFGGLSFRHPDVFGQGQWGWIYTFLGNGDNSASTPLIYGAGKDDGTLTAEDLQDNWIGVLNVSLDTTTEPDQLNITYSADENWDIKIAHLWIGCNYESEGLANPGGNVAPGSLPFKYEPDSPFTEYTFKLNIHEENDYDSYQIAKCENDEYQIAAHGVVGDSN